MIRLLFVSLSLALASACVADDDPPSVVNEPSEVQAEIAADVACEYVARCGVISVACADCEGDDCGGCFVEHERPSYDECLAELGPQYEQRLECEPLSDRQARTLDECLAELGDLPCPEIAAVEAWANGGGGDDPRELTAACESFEQVGWDCQDGDDELHMEPD